MILGAFLLSACAEGELASHWAKQAMGGRQMQGNFKVGRPYQVDGKWYVPEESYDLTETGIASWYGPGFHGKSTANGERFDQNELTAAHRTLQLPSLVRVTNLENGRSLIVRVNDRGPFKRSRVIDVSSRAADLLGFKGKGTAKVKLQVLPQESLRLAEAAKRGMDTSGMEVALNENRSFAQVQPAALRAQAQAAVGHMQGGRLLPDAVVQQQPVVPTQIYVQAGSFSDSMNAHRHAQNLHAYGPARIFPAVIDGRQFYRVRIGPVPSVEAADGLLARLAAQQESQAIIIVD